MAALLDRLRSETHFHRCVADADRVALVGRPPTIDGYLEYLTRMCGFELPLESALSAAPLPSVLGVSKRMKARSLVEQLRALGVSPGQLLNIPHAPLAPLRSTTKALAWLFVSETNRTSHELFWRYMTLQIPALTETASVPPERTTPAQWSALGDALDELALDKSRGDELLIDVVHAFDLQHRWFQPMRPSASVLSAANTHAEPLLRRVGEDVPRSRREPDSDSE